jgi:hypothetical protein
MPNNLRIATVALAAVVFTGPSLSQAKDRASGSLNSVLASSGFRRLPMGSTGGNPFVRASIDRKPATLVVETGSPTTVLDRNFVGAYQLHEMEATGSLTSPMGKTNDHFGLTKLRSIELADIVIPKDTVPVVDLSNMNQGNPARGIGVLGLYHMRKLGAVIDCGNRILYLNPNGPSWQCEARLAKSLTGRGFVRVPMHVNKDDLPEVDCRINNVDSKLVVETAAFGTILIKPVARRAGIRLTETGTKSTSVGKSNAALGSGIANRFLVGTFQTQNQKLYAEEGKFGVLGIDYLIAHDDVIDGSSMSLFLRHQH